MSKYIDSEKLITEIEQRIKNFSIMHNTAASKNDYESMSRVDCALAQLRNVLAFVESLQQEQPKEEECVWVHKKHNREYRIVSDNARLKNSNGEWIDCVIYAPLYENEFEMFAREKESFYNEFEKK